MSPSQSTELDTNRYDWEAGSNDDSGDDFPLDPDRAVPKEDMKNEADPLLDEYYQWMDAVNKALASLKKKHRSLQNELNKAEKVEETVARAQLLTTYIYMFSPDVTSVVVQDWENDGKEIQLTLDPAYGSASEEADALFQRARKLKRGSKVVSDLLEETSQALNTLQEIQTDLDAALLDDGKSVDENLLHLVQDRLLRTSRMTKFAAPKDGETTALSAKQDGNRKQRKPEIGTPASNLRKLTSPGGCTVLVGRNRRGNEYLSLNIAKGNDIWMHSRGNPGAHVLILQRRGGPEATDECLQLAANLAVFYSDSRSERKALVTLAQPKHVVKPRGAPLGAVKLREEWKVLTGFPDDVPEELKQAREESGQLEEYRREDKAKHRKRTRTRQRQEDKRKTKAKRDRNRDNPPDEDPY